MRKFIFLLILIGSVIANAGQPLRTNTATEIMVDLLDTSGDPVESLTTIGDLHVRLFTIAYDASTVTMAAEINPTADGGSVNDLVHEADGMWTFELAAANINFVGRLNISISDPDNDDFVTWSKSFEVYSATIFDGLFGATTAATAALTAYDPPTNSEIEARTQANSGEAMVNWLVFWDDDEYDSWYDLTDSEVVVDVQQVLNATPWDSSSDKVLIADNAITEATTAANYLAEINVEVDLALNTAIPGGPTAHSINQRVAAIDDLTQASGDGDLAAIDGKLDTIDSEIGNLNNFDPVYDAIAVVTLVTTTTTNTDMVGEPSTALNSYDGPTNAEMEARTVSATAAANLENTYDGTGYANDNAPATQLQLSTIAGGVSVSTTATGINIDEPNGGEQTLTYVVTATHDGTYHEVASDDANNDIDFYYTFNTGDGDNLPVEFHMHGYYEDNNAAPSSTMVIQSYNFNIADWETIITLTDSASDIGLDLPLHVHDVSPNGGTEGEVWIRFNLTTPEVSQNVRINHATVGYVSGGLTAAAVVNEWETQSQSDPTGFHVNLKEVNGTNQTAGDLAANQATIQALLDTSGTLYDNIVAIKVLWDSLTITDGDLEVDIKKLDGTNVKSTSGNIHALPGNI